jgi:hypothetical protein
VARVFLTRGCACVIPYGEGNHGRHHHGPEWRDAWNAWALENVITGRIHCARLPSRPSPMR